MKPKKSFCAIERVVEELKGGVARELLTLVECIERFDEAIELIVARLQVERDNLVRRREDVLMKLRSAAADEADERHVFDQELLPDYPQVASNGADA